MNAIVVQPQQPTMSRHVKAVRHSTATGLAGHRLVRRDDRLVGRDLHPCRVPSSRPAQFVVDFYAKKVQHPTGGIVGELRGSGKAIGSMRVIS